MRKLITDIECIYRARVQFEINSDENGNEKVLQKAFSFKSEGLEIETYEGCPACAPYITVEGENKVQVYCYALKIENYIKRFKDYSIE